MELHVVDHPLVADRLRVLRDVNTPTAGFRAAMDSLGTMLCYEAFRHLPTTDVEVTTPLATMTGTAVTDAPLIVPVLRAGLGLLTPATQLLPGAQVGFVGMARNETTHQPESYLASLPERVDQRHVVVLDPMLATGGSMLDTLAELARRGAGHMTVVCALAAPEGIDALRGSDYDVTVYTAAVDDRLNDDAFIVPGLGDAGDRLFGPR